MKKFYLMLAVLLGVCGAESAFAACRITPITYSFSADAVLNADGVLSESGFCRITFWTNQGVYTDVSVAKNP